MQASHQLQSPLPALEPEYILRMFAVSVLGSVRLTAYQLLILYSTISEDRCPSGAAFYRRPWNPGILTRSQAIGRPRMPGRHSPILPYLAMTGSEAQHSAHRMI